MLDTALCCIPPCNCVIWPRMFPCTVAECSPAQDAQNAPIVSNCTLCTDVLVDLLFVRQHWPSLQRSRQRELCIFISVSYVRAILNKSINFSFNALNIISSLLFRLMCPKAKVSHEQVSLCVSLQMCLAAFLRISCLSPADPEPRTICSPSSTGRKHPAHANRAPFISAARRGNVKQGVMQLSAVSDLSANMP